MIAFALAMHTKLELLNADAFQSFQLRIGEQKFSRAKNVRTDSWLTLLAFRPLAWSTGCGRDRRSKASGKKTSNVALSTLVTKIKLNAVVANILHTNEPQNRVDIAPLRCLRQKECKTLK